MNILERIKLLPIKLEGYDSAVEILNCGDITDMTKDHLIEEWDAAYVNDIAHEMADSRVDVYNNALMKWLAEDGSQGYIDRAFEDGYLTTDKHNSVVEQAQAGQYIQILDEIEEELSDIYSKLEALDDDEYILESKITDVVK